MIRLVDKLGNTVNPYFVTSVNLVYPKAIHSWWIGSMSMHLFHRGDIDIRVPYLKRMFNSPKFERNIYKICTDYYDKSDETFAFIEPKNLARLLNRQIPWNGFVHDSQVETSEENVLKTSKSFYYDGEHDIIMVKPILHYTIINGDEFEVAYDTVDEAMQDVREFSYFLYKNNSLRDFYKAFSKT